MNREETRENEKREYKGQYYKKCLDCDHLFVNPHDCMYEKRCYSCFLEKLRKEGFYDRKCKCFHD